MPDRNGNIAKTRSAQHLRKIEDQNDLMSRIKELKDDGCSISKIAVELQINESTVRGLIPPA